MSSKSFEENGYGIGLDLLIILHYNCMFCIIHEVVMSFRVQTQVQVKIQTFSFLEPVLSFANGRIQVYYL